MFEQDPQAVSVMAAANVDFETLSRFSRNSACNMCHPRPFQNHHLQFIRITQRNGMDARTHEVGDTVPSIGSEQHTIAHVQLRTSPPDLGNIESDWAVLGC
jgi:hypothetical protein